MLFAGLGRVTLKLGVFEVYKEEILIGYVKNGDTTGIVYPEYFLLENAGNQDALKFSIYPNPVKNYITVELSTVTGTTHLFVLNTRGKEMMEQLVTNRITRVDVSSLPAGVYLFKIVNDGGSQVRKFVKQ